LVSLLRRYQKKKATATATMIRAPMMAPANAPELTPVELLLAEAPSWSTHLNELQELQSLEKARNWDHRTVLKPTNLLICTHCWFAVQLQGGGGPHTTQDWDCLGQS
jgi:hypothetical protein